MPIPPDWAQKLQKFVEKLKADPNRPLGDDPFDHFVLTEHAASWNGFLSWTNELKGEWGFRGQRDAEWLLHPSEDRAILVEYKSRNTNGYYHLDRRQSERELLFQFKQRAHQYINQLPAESDLASWLGLMQHHGIPTRFLDWTHSPYVAMYFALEEQAQGVGKKSGVWAINLDWVNAKIREILSEELPAVSTVPLRATVLNEILDRIQKPLIMSIDPEHSDQRLAAQQGFFLCKLIGPATFNQILMTMMIHPSTPDYPVVRKLDVSAKNRIGFLKRLRTMNIHRASLFPDLDGFCRFLSLNLDIKTKEAGQELGPSIADLERKLRGQS